MKTDRLLIYAHTGTIVNANETFPTRWVCGKQSNRKEYGELFSVETAMKCDLLLTLLLINISLQAYEQAQYTHMHTFQYNICRIQSTVEIVSLLTDILFACDKPLSIAHANSMQRNYGSNVVWVCECESIITFLHFSVETIQTVCIQSW